MADTWGFQQELAPALMLWQFTLREPGGAGAEFLNALTQQYFQTTRVPVFTAQLCAIGLPFRVHVKVGVNLHKDGENTMVTAYFTLPPFMVEPHRVDALNDWATLLSALQRAVEYKIEYMEGLPSGVVFVGVDELVIMFVPQGDLQHSRLTFQRLRVLNR